MKGRVYVPDIDDLKKAIMKETHCLAYAIHLGSTKNVSNHQRKLFVVWYEERHNKICVQVSYVPTSEGRTSETYRNFSAFAYIGMEV